MVVHQTPTTVIIGAGPAGMAAAFDLYSHGKRCVVIEKSDRVGGLSATYRFGSFLTDNGPHRFYSKNQALYDLIGGLLGDQWITVARSTRFFIRGTYFKYPIDIQDVMRHVPPRVLVKMMSDYIRAQGPLKHKPKNFEDYAIQKFGRTLAEFNILQYTEKIWGIPCSELSPDWGSQRIAGVSVTSLLTNVLFKNKNTKKPKSMVDYFYYPRSGTGMIYEEMYRRMRDTHVFTFNASPIAIDHDGRRIAQIYLNQASDPVAVSSLISSMPLPDFIECLRPAAPGDIIAAARSLRYRAQVYLFLTINLPSVTPHQWIYFPDPDIPFGRVSEMKNFSDAMAPPDQTSLFVEFFCWEGDDIWQSSTEQLVALAVPALESAGLVKEKDITGAYAFRRPDVYPVYDHGYEEKLRRIFAFLDCYENLSVIGRPGRFQYTNQDHSIEMGLSAARSVREGGRFALDHSGGGQEYFEAGVLAERQTKP